MKYIQWTTAQSVAKVLYNSHQSEIICCIQAKKLPNFSCCIGHRHYCTLPLGRDAFVHVQLTAEIVVRCLTPLEKHVWQQLSTMEFIVDYFYYRFLSKTLTNRCSPKLRILLRVTREPCLSWTLAHTNVPVCSARIHMHTDTRTHTHLVSCKLVI